VFYNAGTSGKGIAVTFGAYVTKIPEYLFATGYDKSNNVYAKVTSVSIPCSIRTIGQYAFANCYELKTLNFRGDALTIADTAFQNVTSTAYYPKGTISWNSTKLANYGGTLSWTAKTPLLTNVTLLGTTPHITGNIVRWSAVKNAQFYQIYRRTDGEGWSFLSNTGGTAYKDTTAVEGITYYYTVRARRGGDISPSFNRIGVSATRPVTSLGTVQIYSTLAHRTGNILYWDAVTNAKFYQVFRRTPGGTFTWLANTTSLGYKDTTAKYGTSYIYAVKAANGTVRSTSYSNQVTMTRPRT
jgi:hypothetical protein